MLFLILGLLIGVYLLDLTADVLNVRFLTPELPEEFRGVYDHERYRKSQEYLRDNTRFGIVSSTVSLVILIAFILSGGFNALDRLASGMATGFGLGSIGTGLIFVGTLAVLAWIIGLPFALYHTFVLEEKYGFNRTTPATYVADTLKGAVLAVVLGGPLFAGLLYFFEYAGEMAWLYAWIAFTAFELVMMFLAPVLIMPIFNKFTPLPEGDLRRMIEDFARSQDFHVRGIFTMDGSKRTSKANAFFTGFGKYRRIVFFDTLLEKLSNEEIVAVLAHEIGHYKKRHIVKSAALSIASMGVLFFVLSRFINNPELFDAFAVDKVSIYASIVFVSILFSPFLRIFAIFTARLSRKYEFEADRFACLTFRKPEALISALKGLSRDNLSNLSPHRLKVLLDYSHPPVLERITALRAGTGTPRR